MPPRLRLLFLLLPSGCAMPEDREVVALRQALDSGRASLAAVGHPIAAESPPGATPRTSVARLERVARPGAPGHPTAAAQLLGTGPETLRRWLGEPALRRREGTAEVWLYLGDGCALDLVLYPARDSLRVALAEARASSAGSRTEAACLHAIAAPPGLPALPSASGPSPPQPDAGA